MKKILFTACVFLIYGTLQAQVSESDFQALKTFYEATGGKQWSNNKGWDFSQSADSVKSWDHKKKTGWYGISTSNGRVTAIWMPDNNLQGELPESLYQLTDLSKLDLSKNKLGGAFPQNIGNLILLTTIDLSNNKLKGSLPTSFINVGKNAVIPKRDDGYDRDSRIFINLTKNRFKILDTSFLAMPLLNKGDGFVVLLDKNCFKEKTPLRFKKISDTEIAYGHAYVSTRENGDPIFAPNCVDVAPKFKGSDDIAKTFSKYISRNVKTPNPKQDEGTHHRVVITFIINKNNEIIIKNVQGNFFSNLEKIITESAQYWKPGQLDGKDVSCSYTIPVVFTF